MHHVRVHPETYWIGRFPLRVLQVIQVQLPSVQALGQELPEIVATLHSDMRQVVRDLESLAKAHSAAADVAPVCGQVWLSIELNTHC